MKLKSERKSSRKRCKPFLILPSITNDSFEKQPDDMTNKNTGLKLFTKTWLPKRDAKVKKPAEYPPRPLTATLEAPTILDISLMGKIDMSKIRKEFLNISNLCRVPLVLKNRKAAKVTRPLSLPPAQKKKKKTSDAEDNWEKTSARKAKNDKINDDIKKSAVVNQTRHNGAIKVNNISDANNNKTRKSVPVSDRTSIVRNDANKSTKLPEPCKTCGRPEQPERFHSHPATPMRQARKMEQSPKAPVKSIVQKPVAIKYKSKTKETEKKPSPNRKPASPPQKMVQTPSNAEQRANSNNNNKAPAVPKQTEPVPRAKSAKRTLTCYLCGREFGTASLPLHEPKCLQYNGEYFQQHEGTAMGNSLSPFIANPFMSKFETEVKDKFEYFPRVWFRYVDDIFAVLNTKAISLDNFVAKLNNRFPTIKFTYEVEHNEQLPFLDVLVIRNSENKLDFDVYRKETATLRYIPNDSHHPFQHKMASFNFLIHRLIVCTIAFPKHSHGQSPIVKQNKLHFGNTDSSRRSEEI
ncbi:hypothetical protein NQ318_011202 [Aromia moschata]|uniref:Reverse transcriptase domain-containing protein n=1 Tax=Aromia moschata TaxID=1265417 RepID=A0AAV8X0Y2_9CUCU|nr:hypothetical protein NQ318_011202 [Aromia moschata]